jgi:D-threo-aldose 1-dehydrogenase
MGLPDLGPLGFGTGPFGARPPQLRAQSEAAVHAALAGGVRHFDTAPFYGLGQAERWLGSALAGVPRSDFLVSTKVGRSPVSVSGELRAEFDFSRDSVLRSLEESLTRLGLDAVDIVLIHDPDEHWEQAVSQAYPALAELRAQGVIAAIGVGMNQWQLPARLIAEADPDVVLVAGRYTLLDQSAGAQFLPLAMSRNVPVIAAGVFNSGILATEDPHGTYNYEPAPPDILERARRTAAICHTHGVSLPQAALAFPSRHPAVASVLVGAESPDQVRRNLDLFARPVPAALWIDLAEAGLIAGGGDDAP